MTPRILRILLTILAFIPVTLAIHLQMTHWVNIPIWDEWDTPGNALLKAAEHRLSWSDLAAQHNESRKIIPRLVYLALAVPGTWDVRYAMVLTLLCYCATSGLVFVYFRKSPSPSTGIDSLIAWAIANALLFAPSQYENLLSGFVFELFIPVLCLFGCIHVNLSQMRLEGKVGWNSLFSLIATYTFGHGMLVWLFAFPVSLACSSDSKPRLIRNASWYVVFAITAATSITCYFINYQRPAIAPPLATLSQAGQVVTFFGAWLGGSLRTSSLSATTAGTIGGIVFLVTVAASVLVMRQNRSSWRYYYPWLLLTGFSLASGFLTAISRVNIGVDLVLNEFLVGFSGKKYYATSVIAWLAVIGLLLNLYRDLAQRSLQRKRFFGVAFTWIFCFLAGVFWINQFREEQPRLALFRENRERAKTAVTWGKILPENPDLYFAYPYTWGLIARIDDLRRQRLLSMPAITDHVANAILDAPPTDGGDGGKIEGGQYEQDKARLIGWATIPGRRRKADYVVVGWGGQSDKFHPFTVFDLAESDQNGRFAKLVDVSKLPKEAQYLQAWAIDFERQEVFPMAGSYRLNSR